MLLPVFFMWAIVLYIAGVRAFILSDYRYCMELISLALFFTWLTRDLSGWRE